jgi:hypothetical protein
MFTEGDILTQLDERASNFRFPVLDNGYCYPVDVRLRAFRDATRWIILIEDVCYSPRAGALGDQLYLFGNCLHRSAKGDDDEYQYVVLADEYESDSEPEHAREGLREILVRGAPVTLEAHADPGPFFELFRSLTPRARELLFASESEVRARVPPDVPEVLRLEEWHHPDVVGGARPSESDTFRAIARVLVTGAPDEYRPTKAPNTHWSNWPGGGQL